MKKTHDERFRKSERLLKRKEFLRVQKEGVRVYTDHFVILIAQGAGVGYHRLGITVSKKVGSSVRRNRIKRLIREFFRTHKREILPSYMPMGADIVVIVKPACPYMKLEEVARELGSCLLK